MDFLRLNSITARFAAPDSEGYALSPGYPLDPQNSQRERKKEPKKERERLLLLLFSHQRQGIIIVAREK